MSTFKEYLTKVKDKMKAATKKFPFMPAFVGGMVVVIVAAHFIIRPDQKEVVAEQPKAEVVAVAPAPVQEAVTAPSPEVKVYTIRVPTSVQAGTQDQRPIVVEIHQTQPAAPAQPEPAPAPKEMPEHLKITPENIARMQGNGASGNDEFDVDFDLEPEKEVKK